MEVKNGVNLTKDVQDFTLRTATRPCSRETEEDLNDQEIYWAYGSEDSTFSPQNDL